MHRLAGFAAVLLLGAAAGCGGSGAATFDHEKSVLAVWFEQTNDAVAAQRAPDPVAARTWALAWWAADRATAGRSDGPFADAAVASAVHDVLLALMPTRQKVLDAALGHPRDAAGAGAGRAAAGTVLAERGHDGLTGTEVQLPFAVPAARPGGWRPTPPAFPPPAEVGVARATPFLLRTAAQFRPGPPPQPGAGTYRRDLAEVRDLGRDTSTTRTAEQTQVALFWSGSELEAQVRLLRQALRASQVSTVAGTRLLSAFHRITADAEIAVFDAKYTYLSWRPISALRLDGDNDARTPRLPDWQPLIPTPGHPEYPSAHTVYAAAAAAVLEHFLGPAPVAPLVIDSAGLAGVERTYATWEQAVAENEDARVWAGIHYRTSDAVGSALGRAVAAYDLNQLG